MPATGSIRCSSSGKPRASRSTRATSISFGSASGRRVLPRRFSAFRRAETPKRARMTHLKDFSIFDQVLIALSLVLVGFLLIDPSMVERANALQPGARRVFKTITDLGRSNWMLIPTGAAVALALVLRKRDAGFRNAPAYGLIASTIGLVFVSIGGAGLIATLVKN